jgi:hypothetical protein
MTIEQYFQQTEGCTYKEFCNIYNNGKQLYGNLSFTDFPQNVIKLLQKNLPSTDVLPRKLYKFLVANDCLLEYEISFLEYHKGDHNWNRDYFVRKGGGAINTFSWSGTSYKNSSFWADLHHKYQSWK